MRQTAPKSEVRRDGTPKRDSIAPVTQLHPSVKARSPDRSHLRANLYLLFALSGLAGLVYEATWTRYLQLFLGHAAYAQVLVLSLFMGGMGVGSLLAGRLGHARVAPLVVYGIVEAALGVAAFAFHPAFDTGTKFAYETLLPAAGSGSTALAWQWLVASALILPQSLLLGMTVPLMSVAVLRLDAGAGGRVIAMVYFANSAGAVVGVLLAGFWLIESYGLRVTMMSAGGVSLCIAAGALLIAGRLGRRKPTPAAPARSRGAGRWLLVFAFLTALASFIYEIAWLRMLALVQGASTHAFEIMLNAFILGIALGGLWIRRRIERYPSALAALARVQIFMGLAALATLPAYNFAFDAMQAAMARLPLSELGYIGYNITGYLISAAIMVPASFFAGMTLPLITFVLYARGSGEAAIGAVYGWNTLGGIAGVAFGGLVLMPALGLKNMLAFGAALDIALGLALAAVLIRSGEMAADRRHYALAVASVAVLAIASFAFRLDPARMASSVFRYGNAQIHVNQEVVHHADGRTASVDLIITSDGALSITTNGKADASINMLRARGDSEAAPELDEYTGALLAAVPLAYAPWARSAAVIGHGSGLTTQVMAGSPAIEKIDVVEIEPQTVRAARAFLPRVSRSYEDARVNYFIEDARAFLARTPQRYDLIVSEPSNPWVSGVASLYTPEFYRQAARALSRDGLFVQWFHLYEIDRPVVRTILRGISVVFPDYVLYAANASDVVLVASTRAPLPPFDDAIFAWPQMRAELAYLDIRSPAQLRMFRIASRRAYAPLLESGPLNSDYFPKLEFDAVRTRFLRKNDRALIELAREPVPLLDVLSGFAPPELPEPSAVLAHVLPRFLDVQRAHDIARLLAQGSDDALQVATLPLADRRDVALLRAVGAVRSAGAWEDWFSALFSVSNIMYPSGGTAALEQFLGSATVSAALRGAPAQIREKVAFLLLVGKRDLGRIRSTGPRLLTGAMQARDPRFHAYVFAATATACLGTQPDASCRALLASLERNHAEGPLFDLLRAHWSAQR